MKKSIQITWKISLTQNIDLQLIDYYLKYLQK